MMRILVGYKQFLATNMGLCEHWLCLLPVQSNWNSFHSGWPTMAYLLVDLWSRQNVGILFECFVVLDSLLVCDQNTLLFVARSPSISGRWYQDWEWHWTAHQTRLKSILIGRRSTVWSIQSKRSRQQRSQNWYIKSKSCIFIKKQGHQQPKNAKE